MTRMDYAVVALFLACMALIGIVIGRRIKGLEDYFAAGRRMPWWMAAISHHVSGYSAWAFVGLAGILYTVEQGTELGRGGKPYAFPAEWFPFAYAGEQGENRERERGRQRNHVLWTRCHPQEQFS